MRILYIDMDTCRADHLGCYGYHRRTSPNIDRIASEGVIFTRLYASDTPCLPSRAALFSGRFGIKNGVVGHGGSGAQLRYPGYGHSTDPQCLPLVMALRRAGFRTVSVSPYADRHIAWWFTAGFSEFYDPGKRGQEIADDINRIAIPWLRANAKQDNWFLHLNYWDPHRPYRIPMEYGNPFESDPPPDWLTQEIIDRQRQQYGPRSAREPQGFRPDPRWPREVPEIRNLDDFKRWIDGYDVGIRYMDDHIGQILEVLDEQGVLDETAIIISGDHGECQGELNVYGDHHTADEYTCHLPMIIRWPGLTRAGRCDALLYQLDLAPTLCELLGIEPPSRWDGKSFAAALRGEQIQGRPYLVLGQGAWTCQRAVLKWPWLMIRTYHPGLHEYPPVMLFNLDQDPHETQNLAEARPEVVGECEHLLADWWSACMTAPDAEPDPMFLVIREGGPLYVRNKAEEYAQLLRETGRAEAAERMLAEARKYPS